MTEKLFLTVTRIPDSKSREIIKVVRHVVPWAGYLALWGLGIELAECEEKETVGLGRSGVSFKLPPAGICSYSILSEENT